MVAEQNTATAGGVRRGPGGRRGGSILGRGGEVPLVTPVAGPAEVADGVVAYTGGTPLERTASWATLPREERHRRAAAAAQEHDGLTLLALTEAWVTLHGKAGATLSRYTLRNYRCGIGALLTAWAQENLLHPSEDAATLWLRSLEAAGKQPATVYVHLAAARALYKALRWARATTADPFADARPAPDKTPAWDKRQPYSPTEVTTLLEQATGELHLIILLASQAGLRISECLALRWKDVALARRELTVTHGKGGRTRIVPLSRSLHTALRLYAQEQREKEGGGGVLEGYVLPWRSDFPVRARLRPLAEREGVPYRGVHALRHACGTRLVQENGGDLEAAARLLGHSSIETTRIYAKWSDQSLRSTIDQW